MTLIRIVGLLPLIFCQEYLTVQKHGDGKPKKKRGLFESC